MIDNLEITTSSGNVKHAYKNGLRGKTTVMQKRVARYDLDGTNEKIYDSIRTAAEDNNVDGGNISYVCKGKRNKAGGYKWAYIN